MFGEIDGLVASFGNEAASQLYAVQMVGEVVEVVWIGVLLVGLA